MSWSQVKKVFQGGSDETWHRLSSKMGCDKCPRDIVTWRSLVNSINEVSVSGTCDSLNGVALTKCRKKGIQDSENKVLL